MWKPIKKWIIIFPNIFTFFYKIKINNKDFVKINPNILKKNLEKHHHILTLKTSGNPYYFFLTKIKGQNCCFYIDQKIVEGHNYPRIIYVH